MTSHHPPAYRRGGLSPAGRSLHMYISVFSYLGVGKCLQGETPRSFLMPSRPTAVLLAPATGRPVLITFVRPLRDARLCAPGPRLGGS